MSLTTVTDLKSIDVLILCGGLGKRLRSVTGESPKAMAAIKEEPFLNILLKYLRDQGFRRVILCTGFKADVIEEYYRTQDLGLEIVFSREEAPLGTGGAVKNARRFVKSDPFLIVNGDCFCPLDYKVFVKFHRDEKALGSVVVAETENRGDFGSVLLDRSKRVAGFLEKTREDLSGLAAKFKTGYVNAGVYCFDKVIFDRMPRKNVFSLEYDLFPGLIGWNFLGYIMEDRFLDIGTPERYQEAQKLLAKRKAA
ncbi:MAG: nucleotidyltransferase family protein [Candidatus Omnitrophota bacterium]|nr:nucleotidyltransferase family protein [Candidatus Omnitrophota bacterium]MDZ4242860.1 nucleotidyltransferase family protein [Candidatus Omnitrophota bacterium]